MRLFADSATRYNSNGGFQRYVLSFVTAVGSPLKPNALMRSGVLPVNRSWDRFGTKLSSSAQRIRAVIVGPKSIAKVFGASRALKSFILERRAKAGKQVSTGASATGTSRSVSPLEMPDASSNTGISGNRLTARFQRIGWFTTSMASRTTTVWKTSLGCLARITGRERTSTPASTRLVSGLLKLAYVS